MDARRLFALVFLCGFVFSFSSTPRVENSLAVMSIWWSDTLKFPGFVYKLDRASFKLAQTHCVPAEHRLLQTLIIRGHPPSLLSPRRKLAKHHVLRAVVVVSVKKRKQQKPSQKLWVCFVLFDYCTLSSSAYGWKRNRGLPF